MKIELDRKKAAAAFDDYVKQYDLTDEKIKLKYEHTYRVCDLCEQIAEGIGLSREETDVAWLSGLLHDVGRFEQLRRFGTFIDAESIDHALCSCQELFEKGKIREFILDNTNDELLENIIRCHSAYRLPESFDKQTRMFANILRDADKIDILKVNTIVPKEEIYNVTTEELTNAAISEEVLNSFYEEHAVLRNLKKTAADHVVGQISLIYELVYPISMEIMKKQGFLEKLMNFESKNQETAREFEGIRNHMTEYLNR